MTWIVLEGEELDDYREGRMHPVLVQEALGQVRVLDPHTWQTGRITGTRTCAKCGLMPFDYDGIELECKSVQEWRAQ